MSEPEASVSFQIVIPKRVRNLFKFQASELDLDMRELGQVVLDYAANALAHEAAPKELVAAIEKFKKEKAKKAAE